MERKRYGKKILLLVILILLAAAVYFMYFFAYTCDDEACFRAHQQKCSKTTFTSDSADAVWKYYIGKGENYILSRFSGDSCHVTVTLVTVKKGGLDNKKMEGLSMICSTNRGSVSSPEEDISKCHGLLKEEMQNTIITKLHNYVVNSLGQISEELEVAI